MNDTALSLMPTEPALPTLGESLSVRQWARLMVAAGCAKNEASARRNVLHQCPGTGTTAVVRGGITRVIAFAELPEAWRTALLSLLEARYCRTFADALRPAGEVWTPPKKLAETTAHNEQRAEAMQETMRAYLGLLDQGLSEKECVARAQHVWSVQAAERNPGLIAQGQRALKPSIGASQLREVRARVEKAGGLAYAPLEIYGHQRCVEHKRGQIEAKLMRKLNLSDAQLDALIAEVKDRSVRGEHLSSVHQSLEVQWMLGDVVPGLGARRGSEPFPITKDQMRGWMASTGARRMGTHGEARYARECAPWIHRDTSTLRPLELLVLDDTRIDLIATDDRNGSRLVELKAYILMDVATRKILAFTVKDGPIGKEDVRAMVARVFRAYGLPIGYAMRILFERGTIACSPAAETLLTSIWPGRVEVHRTSMDGAKRSTVGAFWQSGSGHWMGKGWIESFMRTLSILNEQLPGQRGSHYGMQPAQLGLKGRDHVANLLRYDKGHGAGLSTQMHEQAITGLADLGCRWIESMAGGTGFDPRPRLKSSVLMPKRWVIGRMALNVACYNATTDHRRQGLERIEFVDETGKLCQRMESSDERWTRLSALHPAERIHPADAARLLKFSGKAVTVSAREGVVFDEYPFRGLRFWTPDSLACHAAAQLVTQQKKFVALYDQEAIQQAAQTGDFSAVEVHLLGEVSADQWQPGDPGRYIETLPLYSTAGALDPVTLAQQRADKEKVVKRQKMELIQATGPSMLKAIRDLEHDEGELAGVVVKMDLQRQQMPESPFGHALSEGASQAEPTRHSQQAPAKSDLSSLLEDIANGQFADAEPEA